MAIANIKYNPYWGNKAPGLYCLKGTSHQFFLLITPHKLGAVLCSSCQITLDHTVKHFVKSGSSVYINITVNQINFSSIEVQRLKSIYLVSVPVMKTNACVYCISHSVSEYPPNYIIEVSLTAKNRLWKISFTVL